MNFLKVMSVVALFLTLTACGGGGSSSSSSGSATVSGVDTASQISVVTAE